MANTLKEALARLEALGNEEVRAQNTKNGAGENQYGVSLGDIRKVARAFKSAENLHKPLWATEIYDARLLAILLIMPKNLSLDELDQMVRDGDFAQVADWLNAYVVKRHPEGESLREGWLDADDPWAARAGWSLTAERVAKDPDGLDVEALLDRLESEMGNAPPEVQWTMNACLAGIGIHFSRHRERALAIGEELGVFRDFPTSKDSPSPFAPIWINEAVNG